MPLLNKLVFRHFRVDCLPIVFLGALFLIVGAEPLIAVDEAQFFARVYLSETEAVNLQKSNSSDRVEVDTVTLSETGVHAIRREQRVKMFFDKYRVYKIYKPDESKPYRYAMYMQQPGQHEYMDLMYGVNANGKVHRIDLLVYREPYGGEVQDRRFMRQFKGEDLESSRFRVNFDIIHIVGATISSQSVARGTRKVLGILKRKGMIP